MIIDNKEMSKTTDTDNACVKITEHLEVSKAYDIYLHQFGRSRSFVDLYDVLHTATENTRIYFHLNNPGGSIASGIQLLNILEACHSKHISVHVEAPIYSMASSFACGAMKLGIPVLVGKNVFFMFHDYSAGNNGKGNELFTGILNQREWTKQMFRDTCFPFLSETELDKMVLGQDLYIEREDILKRMEVVKTYLKNGKKLLTDKKNNTKRKRK
jgi:ATP-dependent Clp protease protease subunit